ncbi:MAG: restriction endonuclease [Methanobacteriaceae archaeon]|nr:restriction endonuclease [Methanobacteriaceae archaeon]
MEKSQLINFIAKVMEESGFKVFKNFKTSIKVIDIYAVLPTTMGDFGIVMECNNYDKKREVGIGILKEMEKVGKNLNSSKIAIVTTSSFSMQSKNYANKKNIKLVDRDDLLALARKYSNKEIDFIDNDVEDAISEDNYLDNDLVNHDDSEDLISYDAQEDNLSENQYIDYYSNEADDDYYIEESYSSNNLFGKQEKKSNGFLSNLFSRNSKNSNSNNLNFNHRSEELSMYEKFKPYFSNIIFIIFLVVLVSFLLSIILGFLGVSPGIVGVIELISSLLLSYGLISIFSRNGVSILVKGSIVFFISLIILILLIIFL